MKASISVAIAGLAWFSTYVSAQPNKDLSREAPGGPQARQGRTDQIRCFNANRRRIERAAIGKFDKRYLEVDGTVMVKAEDL